MKIAIWPLRVLQAVLVSGLAVLSPFGGAIYAQSGVLPQKSIGAWVNCKGTADDTDGVSRAFAAASHSAFKLVVDCPVRIHIGSDISRPIFIDDGTAVEFTGAGKFTVDNAFVPAFVIANSSDITLSNWRVEYDAGLPVDSRAASAGGAGGGKQPGASFNDIRLTQWLAANRAIAFERSQGFVASKWSGPTNACAVFFITGDSARVKMTGMQIYAPQGAGAERFIPVVFSMTPNYRSRQTVYAASGATAQILAVPHDLTFSDIALDGTYMGWVGGTQDSTFDNIQSGRYADLQDERGGNVGGLGEWFAPPHLFYLNYAPAGDPGLFNRNIRISHVIDNGVRVGTARDVSSSERLSGNALSLKIGCVNCTVDDYKSARPDGFLDVLSSDGLTISNVDASYDSKFLNDLYPGIRFPQSPYHNVKLENITLRDLAENTAHQPIDGVNPASIQGIAFKKVQISINRWAGPGSTPLSAPVSQVNDVSLEYRHAR